MSMTCVSICKYVRLMCAKHWIYCYICMVKNSINYEQKYPKLRGLRYAEL